MDRYSDYNRYVMNVLWDELNNFNPKYSIEELIKIINDIIDNNIGDFNKTNDCFCDRLLNDSSCGIKQRAFILLMIFSELMLDRNEIDYKDEFYGYYSKLLSYYVKEMKSFDISPFFKEFFEFMYNEASIKMWLDNLHPDNRDLFLDDIKNGLIGVIIRTPDTEVNARELNEYIESFNRNIKIPNSNFKEKDLFYEINIEEQEKEEFIRDLYNKLLRGRITKNLEEKGFIHSSVTKTIFNNLFRKHGSHNFKPIQWIGTKEELNLLITLLSESLISGSKKWIIAVCVFQMASVTGEWTAKKLGSATDYDKINPQNRTRIENIVEELSNPYQNK